MRRQPKSRVKIFVEIWVKFWVYLLGFTVILPASVSSPDPLVIAFGVALLCFLVSFLFLDLEKMFHSNFIQKIFK